MNEHAPDADHSAQEWKPHILNEVPIMSDDFVRIPLLKTPPLVQGDGGIDESALASALRLLIESMEQLTEAVNVASRLNPEILLLVDEVTSHAVGMGQAAWLVDLATGYRVAYSELGRKRLAWAIDMENKNNENHENDDQLCEGAP